MLSWEVWHTSTGILHLQRHSSWKPLMFSFCFSSLISLSLSLSLISLSLSLSYALFLSPSLNTLGTLRLYNDFRILVTHFSCLFPNSIFFFSKIIFLCRSACLLLSSSEYNNTSVFFLSVVSFVFQNSPVLWNKSTFLLYPQKGETFCWCLTCSLPPPPSPSLSLSLSLYISIFTLIFVLFVFLSMNDFLSWCFFCVFFP